MEEVQNVKINWVKKLPADLWGNIAEYLPIEENHLFNLAVSHSKINRKLNKDARYLKRKKKHDHHSFAAQAHGFFSKPIEIEFLEDFRVAVLLANNNIGDAEDQKNAMRILKEILIDPDSDPDIKSLKDEHKKCLWKVSLYGVALGLIAAGLLWSEVFNHLEDFGDDHAALDNLVKKASAVEWDEVEDQGGEARCYIVFTLFISGFMVSLMGISLLSVTGLVGGLLNFLWVDILIAGVTFLTAGLAMEAAIIPIRVYSAKKINRRMDFISEAREYFVEKEAAHGNDVNELVM